MSKNIQSTSFSHEGVLIAAIDNKDHQSEYPTDCLVSYEDLNSAVEHAAEWHATCFTKQFMDEGPIPNLLDRQVLYNQGSKEFTGKQLSDWFCILGSGLSPSICPDYIGSDMVHVIWKHNIFGTVVVLVNRDQKAVLISKDGMFGLVYGANHSVNLHPALPNCLKRVLTTLADGISDDPENPLRQWCAKIDEIVGV